jgi:short-subunit dehydrogenase
VTLNDKTILITGANRGIGRAIAKELANYPTNLLLGMRNLEAYVPIENSNAKSIKPIKLDLSSKESINRSINSIENDTKDLDILINNAGRFVAGPLQKQNLDEIYSLFQVNIVGLIHLTNRLLPRLLDRKQAKIVNNASIAGYAYLPDNSTYSATKAAVVAFSESLRRELENTSVGVLHLVTPGVDTEMMKKVEKTYSNNNKSIDLKKISAEKWAKKIVQAIENDKKILSPTGSTELLKIISHGPPILVDLVSRRLFRK